jgi:cysteine desulfurase
MIIIAQVGTLEPIQEIGKLISIYNKNRSVDILFHSDAAQSIGKVPVDVQHLGVDLLTVVGHKYGAPKGNDHLFWSLLLIISNKSCNEWIIL